MQDVSRQRLVELISELGYVQLADQQSANFSFWQIPGRTHVVSVPAGEHVAPLNAYFILCSCGYSGRAAKAKLGISPDTWTP